MAYAGTQSKSFEAAAADIEELAELRISAQRIARATQRIGQERIEQRERQLEDWRGLTLPEQQKSPTGQTPQVACVQADGGRMQILDRNGESPAPAQAGRKGRYWREMKVGCLLALQSDTFQEDPCPELPEGFANLAYMGKIAREIKRFARGEEPPAEEAAAPEEAAPLEEIRSNDREGRPKVLVRTVVATRRGVEDFGPQLAVAAFQRGFAAALRKAFVADGSEANWGVWQKYFSHYTPIVDFIHALCYVYAAAVTGRPLDEATTVYRDWAQLLWSGNASQLIEALQQRQQELGTPTKDESESTPRSVVAATLRYVRNQQSRMNYAEYRRQGLPIASSHIESTIKQINRRVKGSEKFWWQTAEPILQLAADHLSETCPLADFWRDRPQQATGQRCYRTTQ